ncbi:MAG: hypothetical protein MEQ07_07265 [Aquimonas sp.]|nr:hypothetical protein [Aquimonas sp.]
MLVHLMVPPSAWMPASTSAARAAAAVTDMVTGGLELLFVEQTTMGGAGDVALQAVVEPPATAAMPRRTAPPRLATEPPPTSVAPPGKARAVAAPSGVEPREAEAVPATADAAEPAVRLFRSDGSIALPESVLGGIQAVESEDRMFSYMTPGLAGAESAFRRPPSLDYTPTRFDADWKPVRSIGEDALVTLSEATTYENRSKSFRCSAVPPVCSWGRIDEAVELNDPTTLNPAEAAECQALWQSIVEATEQGDWLKLRRRFDSECRKPLEIDRAPPAPRAMSAEFD